MIRAENLSFGFPEGEVLQNLSFSLEKGSRCALIGSNGAGKTTLLRLLFRPEDFTYEGRLALEDVGRIGYVRQFAGREKERRETVLDYLSRDFLELEGQIAAVCEEMAAARHPEALMDRYQRLLDESQAMDAGNYESAIRRRLHQAGLSAKAGLPLSSLSGGEYKLVQVIRQMLRRPGLLLMDEPDVFLDFENLAGLRDLINSYDGTLLAATHSRYLLNHCFDRIWHLENTGLAQYEGTFPAYRHYRLQKKLEQRLAHDAGAREILRARELVERLRDDAAQVASAQKGRALKSKVSYLNRLLARRQDAPFVELRRPEITLPAIEPGPEDAEVLRVEDYSLSFGETLLSGVSFSLRAGEKLALVGPNGTGKTTLLRAVFRGHPAVRVPPGVEVGFFSQTQEALREEATILETLLGAGFETRAEAEDYLKGYCFDPDSLHRKVGRLSGGERNLLQLALLGAGRARLLLLDEPSSHLDAFAQEALEAALQRYRGAVLMVSHDFYTIASCADRVLYAGEGGLRPMSLRAFRKRVYRGHFEKDYLLPEQRGQELEHRAARAMEAGDWAKAQELCDRLGDLVDRQGG